MKTPGIGIVGIGVYLPEEIRRNDFWPKEVVASFAARSREDLGAPPAPLPGADRVFAAIVAEEMGRWKHDPFHGIVERRVAPEGMLSSDMELRAAQAALADAEVSPRDIDFLLLQSGVPDRALSVNPAILHRGLGLPARCIGTDIDRTCGGFMLQLQLGAAYLQASGARHVLLVQSVMLSRLQDYTNPVSTTFGDAATAVVLGRVSSDEGVLAIQGYMDGHYDGMAVLAPRDDAPWYAGNGPLTMWTKDRERLREVPVVTARAARDSIRGALDEANLRAEDVSFFASHQPTSAFNAICRRAAGLDAVPTVDSYSTLGAMGSCVIPINLDFGRKRGLLKPRQNVVLFSTGAGINWSAAVLRWSE